MPSTVMSKVKEERLRKHFESIGTVTDCCLKFTKAGVFRKFAFIGFKSEQEAIAALKQYNKTFIDASKIEIEIARDFGDVTKPRAWSKYAKDSSTGQKLQERTVETKDKSTMDDSKTKKKRDKKIVNELLDDLKDNPRFSEFLEVHKNIRVKQVWTNDGVHPLVIDGVGNVKDNASNKGLEDSDSEDVEGSDMEVKQVDHIYKGHSEDENTPNKTNKIAELKDFSDLDYLKSKKSHNIHLSESESEEETEEVEVETNQPKSNDDPVKKEGDTVYMLLLKGLPQKAGEKAVREFFHPLPITRLRVPKSAAKRPIGIAYVGFKTEKDLEQALRRNKTFIGGKRIFLKKSEQEKSDLVVEEKPRPWEIKNQNNLDETEDIAETGRLFVRNLCFSCTEDDLEKEFKKYGPLTEVNLPVDTLTKDIKGFAFITYMIPENAVKAYAEMDGKVFQGRMLHVLPAREKKEDIDTNPENSSFKKKKHAQQKSSASSSHNWNALFLGANAVADVIAEKYNASKSDILNTEIKGSLGVRMALGETQIVQETKDFLTQNGVSLDSFNQPNAPRSKTVILVKNLPSKTAVSEIVTVFSPFGSLGRVLLPPSGISAIVEFLVPIEARKAFSKLAYRKFGHVPLYLEWAPMEVFSTPPAASVMPDQESVLHSEEGKMEQIKSQDVKEMSVKDKTAGTHSDDDDDEEDIVGSVLFVKNLNFSTTEESLIQHFKECKNMKTATISKKKDLKNPGKMLSMGYGFVEFKTLDGAKEALKTMQYTDLDEHSLELKISNRTIASDNKTNVVGKKQKVKKQTTTKILVRNIPFEAKKHEVEELFKVFGELKSVRLPKKMSGTGSHRGFGFVDFLTRNDAKRAFESLCQSTHLYGRRLVLEWAEMEEDIDDIRKRVADHFHDTNDYGGKKKFTKSALKETLEMSVTD